jgi:hypothetical protein
MMSFGPVEGAIYVWMQWVIWLNSADPVERATASERLQAWGLTP